MAVKISPLAGGKVMEHGLPERATTQRASAGRGAPSSPFLELGAKVFMGPTGARVVAVAACYPGDGTTHVCRSLHTFLSNELHMDVALVTAAEYIDSAAFEQLIYERSVPDGGLATRAAEHASPQGNRIVLIDCPAILASATALRLLPYVDGVLLVVKDGARTKTDIQRVKSVIETVQGHVLGAILNLRRPEMPGWLYSIFS